MMSFEPARPFRSLFLDFNSFFASVEQQDRPELRGRPVGVVAVMTDSSVLLAASIEAKRHGLHTGSLIGEAKRTCPDLVLVEARHPLYVEYHEKIAEAVAGVRPIERVCSVDEMVIRLTPAEADRESAGRIAHEIKAAVREKVGELVTCSIGLAPNAFLAKIATEMEKPDGLVFLLPSELEARIGWWRLAALPGINRRMTVRLNLAGIYTMIDLLRADRMKLREAFGSVIGARWWHLLRGDDLPEVETKRRTISHSHVLAPEFRTRDGSYQVLMRLIEKASARMRREGLTAGLISFFIRSRDEKWEETERMRPTRSTLAMIEALRRAWRKNVIEQPIQVGVVLGELGRKILQTPSLFENENRQEALHDMVDKLNGRFGKHTVLPAVVSGAKHTAEEKIAFQKTQLFNEGGS